MPDVCHGPDWFSIRAEGKTIENPAVLEQYHNAPAWIRITSTRRETECRYFNTGAVVRKEEKEDKEEEAMKHEKSQGTMEIMKLIREGVKPKDIAVQLNVNVQRVYDTKQDMKDTEKKAPKAKEAPSEKQSAPVVAAFISTPTPPKEALKLFTPDISSLHAMLDAAAKLPALKEIILKSCEEMEQSANYILHQVKQIREALGA